MRNRTLGAGRARLALPVLWLMAGFAAADEIGISVSPPELDPFVPLVAGYNLPPAAQTITIAGNGTGVVNLALDSTDIKAAFMVVKEPSPRLTGTARSTTFTVSPKVGLPVGVHAGVLKITGVGVDDGIISTVRLYLSFEVLAKAAYRLTPSLTFKNFGYLPQNYDQPYTQTIIVTNTGTESVTLGPPASEYCEIGDLSRAVLPTNGTMATFTVRPKGGLPPGEYVEDIVIAGGSTVGNVEIACTAKVSVTFVVEAEKGEVDPPGGGEGAHPVLADGIVAGPNPVRRSSAPVSFYRSGSRVADALLSVYDATGNTVGEVRISDDSGVNSFAKRAVGKWDMRDIYGRRLPEATYLVRGTVQINGKRERVSILLGVVK